MKKKITLKEIEVKSFVTQLDGEHIKGGNPLSGDNKICDYLSNLGHSFCRTCGIYC